MKRREHQSVVIFQEDDQHRKNNKNRHKTQILALKLSRFFQGNLTNVSVYGFKYKNRLSEIIGEPLHIRGAVRTYCNGTNKAKTLMEFIKV